jgi:pimeloyl-ACP methyl ester carboxylesterase
MHAAQRASGAAPRACAKVSPMLNVVASPPLAPSAAPQGKPGCLRAGAGEPLVLLHGVLGGGFMWRHVLPLLAHRHDVFAPSALGHLGGHPATERPTRIAHVVDDAERLLDTLGLARAHLAGNSMGGWVALELARRGRAKSVCALSPAGMWEGTRHAPATGKLRRARALSSVAAPIIPLVAHSSLVRRVSLRDNATSAGAVSPRDFVELAAAARACDVAEDLLGTPDSFAPLDVTCPTLIAWCEHDRIFPLGEYAARARARVPGAEHVTLRGVGHVPMMDDPRLVADAILATSSRAP